jgi:membrane associated rhomboid family serine protease
VIPLKDDNPTRSVPFVVLLIIAANIGVFLHQSSLPEQAQVRWIYTYALTAADLFGHGHLSVTLGRPAWITLFTSMFLHGSVLHLGFNMLFLWVFGNNIEDLLGHVRFVFFYLACGLAAAGLQLAGHPLATVPMLGASGAIAGVLGAYLLRYPHARVHCWIFPIWFISLPAVIVLALWFALQLSGATSGAADGVAYLAHIGGFVGGLLLITLLGSGRRGRRRRD